MIDYLDFEDSWFMLGSMRGFAVHDAENAQGFMDVYLAQETYAEVSEQEEIQLGGHTIHCFKLNVKETGEFIGRYGVIELGSDVVFDFAYSKELSPGGDNEEILGAMRFVVE